MFQADTEMSRNMADMPVASTFVKAMKALCKCCLHGILRSLSHNIYHSFPSTSTEL